MAENGAENRAAGESSGKRDVFPQTRQTWILQSLGQGPQGLQEVRRHIMEVYYRPLQVYFMGCSFRGLGDPEEIVAAFFADRLSRPEFLSGWQERQMRLRYWLIGAFKFFLHEHARRKKSDARIGSFLEEGVTYEGNPEEAVDRAFARAIVHEACRRTQARCEREGLGEHWRALVARYYDSRSYEDLARELGVDEARVRRMVRTARDKYRVVLRDLLKRDGADSHQVDEEIQSLLEAIGS